MKMEGQEMQGEQMRLEFESRSENEKFARMVVAAFMLKCNPTVEELEDVKTAVSEAVTNCIIHGYENEIHTIRLTAALDGAWLTVTVEDDGDGIRILRKPWNPCIRQNRSWIAPAWAFPLWKPLWTSCMWCPGRGGAHRYE